MLRHFFIFVSLGLSQLVSFDFRFELHSVDHKEEIDLESLEDLQFLVDLSYDRELELGFVVGRRKIGLIENTHGVNSDSLSPELFQGAVLKGFSDVRIKTLNSH